jgi:WD40 repeat protein/uncharacterized caspase-like protein
MIDPTPQRPPVLRLPDAAEKPRLVLDPGGHSSAVWGVFFTPDGRRVVTVSADKTARVFDVQTGDTVRVFRLPVGPGREGALLSGALSPDGKRLAVSGVPFGDGKHGMLVYLLSLETGAIERVLKGHRKSATCLAFSADGKYLATGSLDATIRVHEVDSGRLIKALEGHEGLLRCLAFAPRGDHFVALSKKGVRIWSWPEGELKAELAERKGAFLGASWSPDGDTLATSTAGNFIYLWQPDGKLRSSHTVLSDEELQVTSISYTSDGKGLLYTGIGRSGRAGIFDLQTGRARPFDGHSNTVLVGSVSADGRLAVTSGGNDHEVFVWQTADRSMVQKLQGNGRAVWGVGWSRDSKTIAWGNSNRGDTRTAAPPLEQTFDLEAFDFGWPPTPDFRRVPSTSNGYSLKALDFFQVAINRNGRRTGVFRTPIEGDRIYSFSVFSGNRAVIGGTFGLYLVDLTTGKLIRRFRGHNGMVLGLAPSPDGRYFLTGCSDQTMCIWHPDRDEPLLSLFVAGQDWIAWTPEGYYAASAYGERLMGWLVNHGPESLASFYPAGQFRRSLYQPELVKLVLPAGGTAQALARLGKEKPREVTVAQVLPPAVALVTPSPGRLNQGRHEVKAKAHGVGAHPVTAMRLLVDGRPWQGDKGVRKFAGDKPAEASATWTVDLLPGKHLLGVQAESAVSKALAAPVEVVIAGADDKLPNLYMVAVGISDYPAPMKLRYAAKDARVLSQTFRNKGRDVFGHVEMKLLTDGEATRQGITEAVDWLGSVMTPRDVGVLFFSGHGLRDRRGRFYLVPVDVDDEDPERTCVSGDVLKQALANMPGRLIAILDACHSGAAAPSPGTTRPGKEARADDLVRDLVTDDYGVVVMCSSLGREFSLEGPEAGHGFFTLGLVEALNGRADFNRDRLIHLHELDFYARVRVRQLSQGMQHPTTGRPPTIRSFPLAGLASASP